MSDLAIDDHPKPLSVAMVPVALSRSILMARLQRDGHVEKFANEDRFLKH